MDEKGEKDIWEGRIGRERGNKIRKVQEGAIHEEEGKT